MRKLSDVTSVYIPKIIDAVIPENELELETVQNIFLIMELEEMDLSKTI